MGNWSKVVAAVPTGRPILIAGPTASGKSDLALEIAREKGGRIINADALQVFEDWRILTARPDEDACAEAPHFLYGHVAGSTPYSVGRWLRELTPLLGSGRPIIVGGTGLYFAALTEGLAEIPEIPMEVREAADERIAKAGIERLLSELDVTSAARIDAQNPARVQRAWEVLQATGRGIAEWQAETGPPLLPLRDTIPIVLSVDRDLLAARIDDRFKAMLSAGLEAEVRSNEPGWSPDRPSAKAIGAAEMIAYVRKEIDLPTAAKRVTTLTRQYAKRQRSWFRSRMADWHWIDPNDD